MPAAKGSARTPLRQKVLRIVLIGHNIDKKIFLFLLCVSGYLLKILTNPINSHK
jgi:hypothetical protein